MAKNKFNFLASREKPTEITDFNFLGVRTRTSASDKFAGLKGRDYIAARQLGKLQTSAQIKTS